jgi:formyl-CoA transferase
MKSGPLAGIRVLDLTSVVLGPLATQVLGDYGADVIKVEPLEGDLMRANGVSLSAGMSSIFLAINRNKRSIAIDLKSAEGADVLRRMIPTVDVLVHNMRMQAIERLGFGYEAVRALHPGIVWCAATGFGQDGPHRDRPAFDDIVQSACGLVALNRENVGTADYVPTLLADKTTGLVLASAVLAALVHRLRTGEGQQVEVPMLETMTAFVLAEHLGGLTFDPPPSGPGYARLLAGGRRPVPTADGHVSMLPYTGEHWAALLHEVGREEAIERLQVMNRYERNRHVRELYALLAEVSVAHTTAHWVVVCERLDIPVTPIYRLDELPAHPHLQAVGMFETARHPTEGPVRFVRPSVRFSETPAAVRRLAPHLGADTRTVLAELGYSDDDVRLLFERKAVAGD